MISSRNQATISDSPVTLRLASGTDAHRLLALAQLDSTEPPAQPVLLAEIDGRLVAALGLSDGAVAADPFHGTIDLIALLRIRARQLAKSLTPARPRTATSDR